MFILKWKNDTILKGSTNSCIIFYSILGMLWYFSKSPVFCWTFIISIVIIKKKDKSRKEEEKMEYRYEPEGVCSQEMIIEVDGDTIKKVTIQGGCAGNTVGVSRLIEGMKIQEAIKRLKGIQCGYKGTSCPDQLAIALEKIVESKK